MCRRDVEKLVWHFDELATRSQACQSCIDIPCQSHKSVMCYKRTLHHGTPCWPHQSWATNDGDDRFSVFQNNDKAILVSRFSCDRLIIIWTFAVEPGVHNDWCVVRFSSQNHSKRNAKAWRVCFLDVYLIWDNDHLISSDLHPANRTQYMPLAVHAGYETNLPLYR